MGKDGTECWRNLVFLVNSEPKIYWFLTYILFFLLPESQSGPLQDIHTGRPATDHQAQVPEAERLTGFPIPTPASLYRVSILTPLPLLLLPVEMAPHWPRSWTQTSM